MERRTKPLVLAWDVPTGANCQRIDPEDVTISREAYAALKQAAKNIMSRHTPSEMLSRITVGEAMTLLAKDMYWDVGAGKLVLCSAIGAARYCLGIAPEHWSVRRGVVQ